MPVTIPGHELHLALTGLRKVVSKRSTIPALSHVLVSSYTGSGVTITGSDIDTYATYRVQDVHGEITDFQTLIPLEALLRLTKTAQRDRVTLNPLVNSEWLEITIDGPLGVRTHYLNTMHADEFVELPKRIPVQDCGAELLPAYRKAAPFASDDETRFVITGIRLDVEELGIPRVVSTDGRRLCVLRVPILPLEKSVTLPSLKFLLWNKLEDSCALGVDEVRFELRSGPWTVVGRLIEGQYPNWRQVVPSEDGPDSFTLNEADMPMFKEAVQTLPIRYPESKEAPLILREVGGQLELSAGDEDGNITSRVLPTCHVTPGLEVSVNRNKLKEAVECGFTTWTLSGGMNPLCSRDGDNLHVLMPLRIDGHARVPVPEKPKMETIVSKSEQSDPAEAPSEDPQPATSQPITPKEPTPMPMIEQEYDPSEADEAPADNVVPFPTPEAIQQPESLDDLLVMLQDARNQLRDLNTRLGDLAAFVRTQKKQEKQLRTELANARNVLVKLRDIAA